MPLFFNVDNRLRFTVEVMIGNDLYAKSLSEIIAHVTAISKKIKQIYTVFISKEGRVHGQGRVQLVEGLDELFGVLLLLRKNLEERTPREVASANELEKKVMVETRINKFIATGVLQSNDIAGIASFNEDYDLLILKTIKDLLLKYKNTLDSEKPSHDKYIDLYTVFDEIFYNTIVMRYGVENLLIDK
jgi:hypothetical protein